MKWQNFSLSLVSLFVIVGFTVIGPGCASKPAAPPEPGIKYEIGQGAALNRVEMSIGADGVIMVTVQVKNTSTQERQFDVSVKADDGPSYSAGEQLATKVKPGATFDYKTTPDMGKALPQRLHIIVAPVQ